MLRVTDAAAGDPVSLDEAKAQLRIDDTSEDALVTALISAATLSAQAQTQRLFMDQTVEWVLDRWWPAIDLPIAPVFKGGVNSIKYVDWITQEQLTLDPSLYVVKTRGVTVRIVPTFGTSWPVLYRDSPEPVVINFDVGYADASKVPLNVKQAILLTVRHLYSLGEQNIFVHRDSVQGLGDKYVQVDPGAVTLLPDAASLMLLPELWS